MTLHLPPLAVTGVGSMPRPTWLCTMQRNDVAWNLSGAALEEGKADAIKLAVFDMERAGLDVLTEGEQRREHFIMYFCRRMGGFDVEHLMEKTYRAGRSHAALPQIVGPLAWTGPVAVDDYTLASSLVARPVKMAVPGPMTLWDTTYDSYYGDPKAVAMAWAGAINHELKALVAAGCPFVQLDEPAFTRYPELVHDWGIEALDRALDGVDALSAVHLCYGYARTGAKPKTWVHPYTEIFPDLARSRVRVLSLETAAPGTNLEVLSHVPAGKLVMLGVVDLGRQDPESAPEIANRLREALQFLPAERLLVAPDCGLAHFDRPGAFTRLKAMVDAAAAVRAEIA